MDDLLIPRLIDAFSLREGGLVFAWLSPIAASSHPYPVEIDLPWSLAAEHRDTAAAVLRLYPGTPDRCDA